MSNNNYWDIDKHREEHESDDHWQLRRNFMMRWKADFEEERLVCLARVFANIELLGCRYPPQVMQEVARLSHDVAQSYRSSRKDKLKRTFVSASDAAEDRAKGVKREGGLIVDSPPTKSAKYGIQFVKQGDKVANSEEINTETSDNEPDKSDNPTNKNNDTNKETCQNNSVDCESNKTVCSNNATDTAMFKSKMDDLVVEYLADMSKVECLNVKSFTDSMFYTKFGRLVLLVRPWTSRLNDIQASCQACKIPMVQSSEDGNLTLTVNGIVLAQAQGTNAEARSSLETQAWNRLRTEAVSVVVKGQYIAQNDARISLRDVAGTGAEFGAPVEITVAKKMMQMMGWKGGGLGAEAQGIAEPIKPNFQMVNRAGLGSESTDLKALRRSSQQLMQRYKASDALDVDLVFSAEFSKEERALLHQVALRAGLLSKSYGKEERFLVVKQRPPDPVSLARTVIEKGGNTPKYQVFIPAALRRNGRYN